ncbi:MAG: MmcB family DNA repair protein [Aestuariivirgaceae bacterium]|nr:MmcB family DNA repair protein [Aestuariivirgaceae bacterium]
MKQNPLQDGRQSERALRIQRGVARMWRNLGHASLSEFTLASGRRADVLSIDSANRVFIAEIKSSASDFLSDRKWQDYLEWCDCLYFAIDDNTPMKLIPPSAGLMMADSFGAEIVREPRERPALSAPRRKALTLRFAQTAAWRLQQVEDPAASIDM